MRKKTLSSLSIFSLCILSFTTLAATNNQATCSIENPVVANYQIETRTANGTTEKSLQLWRYNHQVAIHYPQSKITELWHKTKNGRLHLVRIFEEHKRGIEYQSEEIKGSHDWSMKQQLVSNAAISSMLLNNTTGEGCELTENYSKKTTEGNNELSWLANKALIKSYAQISRHSRTTWTLQATATDLKNISAKFNELNSIDTTDYTDIGDNESDPFLMGMINLGFVEHGAHGFYDSDGHAMDRH